jgi:hypothetical protein
MLRQPGNDISPLPPVSERLVEQYDGFAAASLSHMHAQAWKIKKVMGYTLERRKNRIAWPSSLYHDLRLLFL